MKKNIFTGIVLMLLFGSCASLTKSQIEAVNHFAATSTHFSAYPSKVMTGLADIRVKRGIYFSNSLDNVDSHIEDLNNLYAAMKDDYSIAGKADITFKIIDKYAQSLLLLSSDQHVTDLDTQARSFGTNMDSLITVYNKIPDAKHVQSGLGGLIGSLILAGGKQVIRSKQAKAIETFVPASDTLIAVMTDNLLEFLQSTNIDILIKNEERGIQSNYKSFLNQRKATIQNERDYLDLKADLDHIKTLREQTVEATKKLRKTHAELLAAVKKEKDLKEVIAALQVFYESVKDVRSTIQQIDTAKN